VVRFWQIIRHYLSAAWFAEVPWPLRVVRGVFILFLIFGSIAAIAWLGFGRDAEQQVEDFGEGVTAVALIFFVPILLVGLIAAFSSVASQ
jgi:hypothetical protein